MTNALFALFDATVAPLFKAAGMADAGTYTAPSGSPVAATFYVDRDIVAVDAAGYAKDARTQITMQHAEVGVPEKGAVITIGSESFKLFERATSDESQSAWWVSRG